MAAVNTLKHAEELCKWVNNAVKGLNMSGATTQATAPKTSTNLLPKNSSPPPVMNAPQFCYTTPAEDPTIIQKVIEKGLDSTVTLTQRELFAITPDVCCYVKEQVTTKWIPIEPTAVTTFEEANPPFDTFLQQSLDPSNLIIANPIENLQTIPLKLEGTVDVEAILDEGSQIIGIGEMSGRGLVSLFTENNL
ncbi:hypothetical protein P691DRAFT_174155 [Macrolepiota fuliginosa MF-IS2]|uniref:Uncharacterized protein n=1 Tax=Macrolepiota fuliginosa MF-IS2 TaxID=1400762 RepID=A0A9P5WY31_9AGAR|nr:hypothetical protein P691DRAFT_174155 [Macrolepiota fuliginosa MF-IS2]